MPKHNVSDSELRDFLRKRITNISTAAEDDIIEVVHKEREAAANALHEFAEQQSRITRRDIHDFANGLTNKEEK